MKLNSSEFLTTNYHQLRLMRPNEGFIVCLYQLARVDCACLLRDHWPLCCSFKVFVDYFGMTSFTIGNCFCNWRNLHAIGDVESLAVMHFGCIGSQWGAEQRSRGWLSLVANGSYYSNVDIGRCGSWGSLNRLRCVAVLESYAASSNFCYLDALIAHINRAYYWAIYRSSRKRRVGRRP